VQILKTQSFRVLPRRLVATKDNEPNRRVLEFNGQPAVAAYAEAIGVHVEPAASRFMVNPVGLVAGDEIFVRSPQRVEGASINFYIVGSELALLESTDIVADTQAALESCATPRPSSTSIGFCVSWNCARRANAMPTDIGLVVACCPP